MSAELKTLLCEIAGAENVLDDPNLLEPYSHDPSFTPACPPRFVVKPSRADQIGPLVRLANAEHLPVVPYSSGTNFLGGAVPSVPGAMVLDLSALKGISELDTTLWSVTVEPGVTFKELQEWLAPHNVRVQVPLLATPRASVLATYLDRESVPGSGDFIYGNEHIQTLRVVMPNGDPFTIGNPAMPGAPHSAPHGPAINWYRLFMCAQGTLGVVREMNLRLLPRPKAQKIFFSHFNKLPPALEAVREIQRQELGYECFLLNTIDLACLALSEQPEDAALKEGRYISHTGAWSWSEARRKEFATLITMLPPWTLVTGVSGFQRQPQAKVAWQEKDLRAIASAGNFELLHTIGRVTAFEQVLGEEFLLPWRLQRRWGYSGTCHEFKFFCATDNLPRVEDAMASACRKAGVDGSHTGAYIQPVERARTFACIYSLPGAPGDQKLKSLYEEASEAMIDAGAFFDRPYGPWAEMMYRRNPNYAEYLRRVKAALDPLNILNPGKLCFPGGREA
jgi:FAD/FMN-containing dehydrogenase